MKDLENFKDDSRAATDAVWETDSTISLLLPGGPTAARRPVSAGSTAVLPRNDGA